MLEKQDSENLKPLKESSKSPQNKDDLLVVDNDPPSHKQLALAIWFATYKGLKLPKKVRLSHLDWWSWINKTITRIDREDAHAAKRDFGLKVDYDDPVSIIGALKYRHEYIKPSPIDEAIEMLKENVHPDTVEDTLLLSPKQLNCAIKRVQQDGYEVEHGTM